MPYSQALIAEALDLRLFLKSLARHLALFLQILVSPVREQRRPMGFLLLLLAFPLFLLLQLWHWFTLLLDEILFRGYRKVDVQNPVFVLGPPRSGTTHLHHILTLDSETTTFRTWECLFGLSVTSRKILLGLARLDRAIGMPFGKLGAWVSRKWLSSMDDIHPISLSDPEEDFLSLMPLAACFIMVVPFPHASWLWNIARFDADLDASERGELLRWYRACIQRHLYVHGPEKRFLSKNASFSGMAHSLLEEFHDSRILFTMRDPKETVPSQLSSLRPGLQTVGFPAVSADFRDKLIDLLAFYYENLGNAAESHPDRVAMLYNDDLRDNLEESVLKVLASVGVESGDTFRAELMSASAVSRQHVSGHRYSLQEFGLSDDLIASRFANAYDTYEFGSDTSREDAGT